jgi:hypothetical protein
MAATRFSRFDRPCLPQPSNPVEDAADFFPPVRKIRLGSTKGYCGAAASGQTWVSRAAPATGGGGPDICPVNLEHVAAVSYYLDVDQDPSLPDEVG